MASQKMGTSQAEINGTVPATQRKKCLSLCKPANGREREQGWKRNTDRTFIDTKKEQPAYL